MSAPMPCASRTDVGRRREHNEDSLFSEPPLIAVADGVGGSAKGEVASRTALDALVEQASGIPRARTSREAVALMEAAVLAANVAVHEAQLRDETLRGMATTMTAAVARDGGEVVVGHVGDSRLYVVSATGARQATQDHSVVAELVRSGRLPAADAAHHPQRNAITRALGPEADVTVDAFVLHVGPGDWLLACSDGLTEHVDDAELAHTLLQHAADPEAAVGRMVDLANERGGTDNISVAVLQPVPSDVSGELNVEALQAAVAATSQLSVPTANDAPDEGSGPIRAVSAAETSGELPRLEPMVHDEDLAQERGVRSRRGRTAALLTLVLLLAIIAGCFVWSQSYFLVEREDGSVGVNRGFPFARLASPHRSSDVIASDLSKSDRARLVESHRLLSREDAERLLDELPERVEPVRRPPFEEATRGITTPP